jgi:hypothetical protein
MGKKTKITLIVICITLVLGAISYISLGALLDDGSIGYKGLNGRFRLKASGEVYTQLTEEPIQYLVYQDQQKFRNFLETVSDSYDASDLWRGTLVMNGQTYDFTSRAFTGEFYIVTFKPAD